MTENASITKNASVAEKRKYRKPVAWLGGRDLLANLKYFLLFAAFKGKLDPRDWMNAEVFPAPLPAETEASYERQKTYRDAFENSFADRRPNDEFWFDYFADSGDGMTAGYAIAYMCMSDLFARLPNGWDGLPSLERRQVLERDAPEVERRSSLDLENGDPKIKKDKLADNLQQIKKIEADCNGVVFVSSPQPGNNNAESYEGRSDLTKLPRGAFLFVGGDTAYHVADFAGLGLRFQRVFDWAFEDLKRHLTPEQAEAMWEENNRRPIFGLPGNHDYYDMIDGFNRQFARPVTSETNFVNLDGRDMSPQLRLWPFKRFQTASYVAIQLPFGWWFWGIDSELTRVDVRQQEYFKRSLSQHDEVAARDQVAAQVRAEFQGASDDEVKAEVDVRFPRRARLPRGDRWPTPEKLIVATSEPTTVEGRRARDNKDMQDKTPQAFSFLDLTRPFLYLRGVLNGAVTTPGEGKPGFKTPKQFREEETDLKLKDFRCRLDISGDTHHYARYWGDAANKKAVACDNYASIVAGGGGASMSPTQTDYDEVEEQVLYPAKEVSTQVINKQLFKPWVVIRGGNVWVAALLIGVIIFFGATNPPSHLHFTNAVWSNLFSFNGLRAVADSQHTFPILKLALLLALAGWAIVASGMYARWLFERLTKTHDWVRDKLENLRFHRKQEAAQSQKDFSEKTQPSPYADKDAAEKLYDRFLDFAGNANLSEALADAKTDDATNLSPIEREFGQDELILESLYKSFLDRIESQKTPGVQRSRLKKFWSVSGLVFLFTALLWLEEVTSHFFMLPRLVHGLLFLGALILLSWCIYKVYSVSKNLADELAQTPHYTEHHRANNFWFIVQHAVGPTHDYVPFWFLLTCPGLSILVLAFRNYDRLKSVLPSFANSVAVLFSIFVAGAAAVVAIYYSKWLFDQAYRIKVNPYSYIPVMGLSAIALLTLLTAITRCAVNEGRFIITDGLYLTANIAVIVGCIMLGAFVGNHLPGARRIGFGVLGLWHGLLQLLVPFLLVWFGNNSAFLLALVVVSAATAGSYWVTHLKPTWLTKGKLTAAWVIYGAIMIAIPLWLRRPNAAGSTPSEEVVVLGGFILAGVIGWALAEISLDARISRSALTAAAGAVVMWALYHLQPAWTPWLLAGLIGALMSCVWLGWYFAVSLVFDGHANEAGSTARTENYKQFIRFRLTRDTLTGYVIGLDFPHAPVDENDPRDGSTLKPRLVDVFTLTCGPTPEPN
ncbi:MAG TPA: DUF998 domain-containing protein [Pyrinomonadaceae bacterium]|jgi:hypothetical protein|nr:DUF998 domain-containing protein [Pyrinomonadaceae bacterium]